MHSRIFYISTSPVAKTDIASELDGYDGLPYSMDYYIKSNDFTEDIKWLYEGFKYNPFMDYNKNKFVIHDGFKQVYFKPQWVQLKQKLDWDKFCNDWTYPYDLQMLINNTTGFLVMFDDGSVSSLDEFIRLAEYDTEYYILESMDYHE